MNERELLRRRIQQLEQELAETQQSLSSELYKMRVSLTPLKGFVRTLLNDEKEEWYTREDRREFYTILDENIDRLLRSILNLQGGKNVAPHYIMNWQAAVDVHQLAEGIVALHQKRADKHTLVLDFEPQQIFIEADAEKLGFLLDTLLFNAIKYSPDGEEVRVRARLESPNNDWPCETLLLQVKDQGAGLSESEMSKIGTIFIAFSKRTPHNNDASGKPWRVKDIIKAHQGKLWPESEGHGKGLTCNIRIPVKQPEIEDIQPE